jgi:hypothetical protein
VRRASWNPVLRRFLLLDGCDCVFCGLGDAELNNGFGFDLDGFASLGVAAGAGLALCLDEAAETGDNKNAVFLGFLDGGFGEQVKEGDGLLAGELEFFGHLADECGFGKCCCHKMFLLKMPKKMPGLSQHRDRNALRFSPTMARVTGAFC